MKNNSFNLFRLGFNMKLRNNKFTRKTKIYYYIFDKNALRQIFSKWWEIQKQHIKNYGLRPC